jgi:hypothetical protein
MASQGLSGGAIAKVIGVSEATAAAPAIESD